VRRRRDSFYRRGTGRAASTREAFARERAQRAERERPKADPERAVQRVRSFTLVRAHELTPREYVPLHLLQQRIALRPLPELERDIEREDLEVIVMHAVPGWRRRRREASFGFAALSEPVIVSIFRRMTDHFGSGELAFNDYGGIGWFSRLAIKLYPQKMFKDVGSQWGYAGFKDAHHPETWNPRMRLVEEASLAYEPEVDLFPGWIRVATKLSGKSKTGARKARILRYAF